MSLIRIISLLLSTFLILLARDPQITADSLINKFSETTGFERTEVFDRVFSELDKLAPSYQEPRAEQMVAISSRDNNKKFLVKALIYASRFGSFNKKLNYLRTAFVLANRENDYTLMAWAQETKGHLYRSVRQYDSAMVSALKAKNFYERAGNENGLVSILHLLADFHFDAAYYTKAEEYYRQILELKGDPVGWKAWRETVIINDLGIIEEKRKNYDKALEYYNKSLNSVMNLDHGFREYDSVRIGYIYRKIANIYFLKKDFVESLSYYNKSLPFLLDNNKYELMLLYTLRGKLFYENKEYDSSIVYLNKSLKLNEINPSLKNQAENYYYLSEIYTYTNNYKTANRYFNQFKVLNDSSTKITSNTRFMQIYAENNYNTYLAEIDNYKTETKYLAATIFIFFLSAFIIGILVLRKRKSDIRTIRQNVKLVKMEEKQRTESTQIHEPFITEEKANSNKKNIDENIKSVANEFKELVEKEKLFLKPELQIKQVAEILNTNRTYLSKAINSEFNVNFSSYINELRVKEAIKLFTQKEHEKVTIESISQEVGFNNRTSFIKAFRNFTGVTPSFFIKNI